MNSSIRRGLIGGLALGLLGAGLLATNSTASSGGARGHEIRNQAGQLVAPGSVVAQLRREGDHCVADQKVGVETHTSGPGDGARIVMSMDKNCRLIMEKVEEGQPPQDGNPTTGTSQAPTRKDG